MSKKKTCAVIDQTASELHDLYEKHEFRPISDKNAIEYCPSCGAWRVHLDRENMRRDDGKMIPLWPRDFGKTGPFELKKVMRRLNAEQQNSLAVYLKQLGYGSRDPERRAELAKYLKGE